MHNQAPAKLFGLDKTTSKGAFGVLMARMNGSEPHVIDHERAELTFISALGFQFAGHSPSYLKVP
jgi:hypothetical protein